MLEAPTAEGLTYAEFHLLYTVPLTFILWLVVRPFMNASLWICTSIIAILAVIYTTPWDNYMVLKNTWAFPENAVILTIGYVPLEEYFFFVIQTFMVFFWSVLCFRWTLPGLHLATTPLKAVFIRWIPFSLLLIASAFCWNDVAAPETAFFYFRCVVGWIFPVLALLWFGTGNYIVNRSRSVILAIFPPTIYLVAVDYLAIRAGVWYINPKSITGIFIAQILPVEEALFFLVVNVVIVFAYCASEKSMAVLHNFPEEFCNGNITVKILRAFFRLESTLDTERMEDLRLTLVTLRRASKSFWSASMIFPSGMRQDLSILYAFCRVTDDMVDDVCLNKAQKMEKLSFIRSVLDEFFQPRYNSKLKYTLNMDKSSNVTLIDWGHYEALLSREELAAFRCLSRIAYQIPAEPLYDLCRGYEWDIDGKLVKTTKDLIQYSEYVASSVGVLCTFIMVNERRDWFLNHQPKSLENEKEIIEAARQMGVSLQLTNIARDIVTDSESLGRCYVPQEFLEVDQFEVLTGQRNPWNLGEETLRNLSIRILDLADEMKRKGQIGIGMLPSSMWPGIIAATGIYSAIGKVIRGMNGYPKRASVSKFEKICILIKALYFPKV